MAEQHGRLLGFAALEGAGLERLYVRPDARGQEVGSALLEQVQRVQRSLKAQLPRNDVNARRFLIRHGFRLAGEGQPGQVELRWSKPRRGYPAVSGLAQSFSNSFPRELIDDVWDVYRSLPPATLRPRKSWRVILGDDQVSVVQQIHHPELPVEGLPRQQQVIAHCLYSCHRNGYVRQRHLRELAGVKEAWVLPYVAIAATDHVAQITEEALNALPGFDPVLLRRFGDDNPDALMPLRQRVASSWDRYHRRSYPCLADHPGHRLVRELERHRSYPRW